MLRTYFDVRLSTQAENHVWEPCAGGRIPPAPKEDGTGNRNVPESFDVLASRLNNKFERLEADIVKMREELRDAKERSEQLKHQLLGGKLL